MLDLAPIKERMKEVDARTGKHASKIDADLARAAAADLAALVYEVERLRAAIKAHRDSLDTGDGLVDDSDRTLWKVLDA